MKYTDADERLTIGKASDLRMCIKQALVKDKVPHSAGKRIGAQEDLSRVVRWPKNSDWGDGGSYKRYGF